MMNELITKELMTKELMTKELMTKECPEVFFFGSAGWGGGYYIGVYKAMQELWKDQILNKKFYGISAGSAICLYILLGYSYEEVEKEYIDMSNEALSSNKKIFMNASYFNDIRFKRFITEESIKKLNGKLFIGVSTFYGKFKLISSWKNKQQLIDTLHASMHIPYYCGNYINRFNGKMCIDGGYAFKDYSFLPDKTLKIGVWNKNIYDIRLTPQLNFKNTRKPNLDYYYLISKKGYEQLINWDGQFMGITKKRIQKTNFIKHLRISTSWLLRISEKVVYKL